MGLYYVPQNFFNLSKYTGKKSTDSSNYWQINFSFYIFLSDYGDLPQSTHDFGDALLDETTNHRTLQTLSKKYKHSKS